MEPEHTGFAHDGGANPASPPPPQQGVKWRFPAIHPEGRKFGAIAAAITLLFFFIGWEMLAWLMVGITVWVFAFFRDPVRVTPVDPELLIAPADGLVTLIENRLLVWKPGEARTE